MARVKRFAVVAYAPGCRRDGGVGDVAVGGGEALLVARVRTTFRPRQAEFPIQKSPSGHASVDHQNSGTQGARFPGRDRR